MRPVHLRALAAAGLVALALAACGSSSKASSPPSTAAPSTAAPSTAAPTSTAPPAAGGDTVNVATTKLGKVLVDAKGLTLYRFDNDTTPGVSTCTAGQCASAWPAATVTGTPTAGAGVDAAKLTTFKRPDGTTQLQIDGHPLYTFAGDSKPGDTNGQGILGKWHAAGPDGSKVG